MPDSGIDTVRAVIRIIDLGTQIGDEEHEVATFEREWSHTFEDAPLYTRVPLTAR